MENFESFKENRYSSVSEIYLHLPILEKFAHDCETIIEFGVRKANSTVAFMSGVKNKLISYDIEISDEIDQLQKMKLPCQWEFRLQNTADPNHVIEETDMLFIDTDHTYKQVLNELMIHGDQATKMIGFHDTAKYGIKDYNGNVGINKAIYNFVTNLSKKNWKVLYNSLECNGLFIMSTTNEKTDVNNFYEILNISSCDQILMSGNKVTTNS